MLLERGYQVVAAPDVKVIHPIRPAPWGTSIRQQQKIRFVALLVKKHMSLYRRLIRRAPSWRYYAIVSAILLSMMASAMDQWLVAVAAGSMWLFLTGQFAWERVRDNSRKPGHRGVAHGGRITRSQCGGLHRIIAATVGAARFRASSCGVGFGNLPAVCTHGVPYRTFLRRWGDGRRGDTRE